MSEEILSEIQALGGKVALLDEKVDQLRLVNVLKKLNTPNNKIQNIVDQAQVRLNSHKEK